jgi:threonine dehydrogenase-like Zn-dependent dehydrogenase
VMTQGSSGCSGAGICGTDKHIFTMGEVKLGLPGDVVRLPIILGHENLGVIEKIGSKAAVSMSSDGKTLEAGQRVVISADIVCGQCYNCRNLYGFPWCLNHKSYGDVISCRDPPHLFGGYAEKLYVIPGTYIFPVPENVTNEAAILTEQLAVAYGAFGRAFQSPNSKEGFAPGDTVVVQGVGPLGMSNVMMARMLGASEVIAIDVSGYRLGLAEQLGASASIGVNEYPRDTDRVERVREMTDRIGADVVIECTGDPNILSEGLDMLRIGGTYLVEGAFVEDKKSQISASRQILANDARIIGVSGMPFQAYARVLRMMDKYRRMLPFEKATTHTFTQDQAHEALQVAMSPNSGKVVVGHMK